MSDSQIFIDKPLPWHHPEEVQELLHKAGLSRQTEMERGRYKVKEAMAALKRNPNIRQAALLRILRPPEEDESPANDGV